MKTKMSVKSFLSLTAALVICLIICLSFAGCQDKTIPEIPQTALSAESSADESDVTATSFVNNAEDLGVWADAQYKDDTVLGTGATTFYFEVQAEDYSVTFTVNTDKETVGDALLEHGIIAGDDGPYGLYVKTVNGILADYDVNSAYWNFTKDGEIMMTGVDGVNVENGAHYEMVYTKG